MIGLACRHLGKKFGASAILCVFRIIHLSLGQVKLIWRICPLLHNIMYQIDCCKLRCWRRLVSLCYMMSSKRLFICGTKPCIAPSIWCEWYLVWIIGGNNACCIIKQDALRIVTIWHIELILSLNIDNLIKLSNHYFFFFALQVLKENARSYSLWSTVE